MEDGKTTTCPFGTKPQDAHTKEWTGSFSSQTIGGALFALEEWRSEAAWLTNEDGSYLTEGQLRLHFGTYMRENFCGGTGRCPNTEAIREGHFEMESFWCGAKCCALPGDTIHWKSEDAYRVVTRWAPATDEELREPGWLEQGGLLIVIASTTEKTQLSCTITKTVMSKGGDTGET